MTNLERDIINFYLAPNSERDTVEQFGLSNRYALNKILKANNIAKHSEEVIKYLNERNAVKGCLAKYGVSNCMQNKTIAEKTKQALLKRTTDEIALTTAKGKKTRLAKYGDENYNNRPKAFKTCLEKYGAEIPMQSSEVKEKVASTCCDKYGVENIFMLEETKAKIKATCLAKYGNEAYTKTQDYLDKTNSTCQEKYNTNYYCQSTEYAKVAHKKYSYNNITFDSSWELALWIYAKDHNESIERCPIKLTYFIDNKSYYCIPDFRYNGKLVEIKGDQFIKENSLVCPYDPTLNEKFNAKYSCLLENNVEIWPHNKIQFALDYINNTYGKKYLQQFKTKTLQKRPNNIV